LEETIIDKILEAFAISLLSIAVAELGDKTQLGLITLAASIRKPSVIFLGMIAGYIVVAGLAVLVGQALLAIIPLSILTLISGAIFIVIGLLMLKVDVQNGVTGPRAKSPFLAAALMIVFTELGDKTQIVTIALAARFAQPIAVFAGVLSAFVVIDGLSIILADRLGKRVPTSKVKKVSAVIFIVLGILTLLEIF
jgi:putative Ca2+/H+ antiporter (TMEM165/GDT1 family)